MGFNSTKYGRHAIRYITRQRGLSDENAKQLMNAIMNDLEIHHSKCPQFKFIVGLSRLCIDNQLNNEQSISSMKCYLKYLSDDGHINQYDENINGLNLNDLSQRFNGLVQQDSDKSRKEVYSNTYKNTGYEIVKIDTEEQAETYGKYATWCITHGSFKQYGLDSFNQCYFCLKPNFKKLKDLENTLNAPFDEYGLSMISVIVNINGEPKYITTRYNHDFNGENNTELSTAYQVSKLIGVNFYETFKPNNRWNELLISVDKRLKNEEDPKKIFDWIGKASEDLAVVNLCNKWNFIDENCNYLSSQWFDNVSFFSEEFVIVELNDRWNWIDKKGNYLSTQWFDRTNNFSEGFAVVCLNNKWNWIDKQGNYLSTQWFDEAGGFKEGFAAVCLNGKWNFIDKQKKYLSTKWFDFAFCFSKGLAEVELNGKWNWIDKNCNYLSTQWFDNVRDFSEEIVIVYLHDKINFIDKQGKLLSDIWFDDAYDFQEGFAVVVLNSKFNFIDKQMNYLSHQWFYDADSFSKGLANVKLNGKCYTIDKRGTLSLLSAI